MIAHHKPRGLLLKFGAILLPLVLLLVGNVMADRWIVGIQEGDALAINSTGQGRYRAYELAHLAGRYVDEFEARSDLASRIRGKAAELEQILEGLRAGNPRYGPAVPPPPDLRESLEFLAREYRETMLTSLHRLLGEPAMARPQQEKILGTLDTAVAAFVVSTDRVVSTLEAESARKIADLRRLRIVLQVVLVLAVMITTFFLIVFLRRPILAISRATERMAGGDLSVRVDVKGRDELAEMARTFNQMAAQLQEVIATLEQRVAERTRELEGANEELQLQQVEMEAQQEEILQVNRDLEARAERLRDLVVSGHRLVGGLTLGGSSAEILQRIVEEARLLVGARYAALGVLNDEGNLTQFLTAGLTAEERAKIGDLPKGHGILGLLAQDSRPIRLADLTQHPSAVGFPAHHPPMKSFLGVPIRFGGRVMGRLYFTEKEGAEEFSQEDEDRAQIFATLAAIASENTRVYQLLQEERNRYWAALNSSSDGLALADLDRVLLFVNRFFSRYFEVERVERFVGRPVGEFCRQIAPLMKGPEQCLTELDRLWADPESAGDLDVELRDGRVFHLHSGPVRNSGEAVIGRYLVFRDITREKEIDRMKSEFVATVSHEIRTPLSSLLGFSELMLHRDLPEEKRRQFLEILHGETQRLTSLINDFLDLQRIEAGKTTYRFASCEVEDLLREAAGLFAGEKRHTLRVACDGTISPVIADRDRIKQVLQNLLSNAVKFSPQGGEVALAARAADGGTVEIAVRDRGLGIPAEAMSRLFTKFFRIDSSDRRAIGGTGLGLALCKEIVEAHGGRIRAESRPGEGSTFSFTLRAEPAVPAPAQVRTTPETPLVLVVENSRPFAALVREHLEGEGYVVRVEETAEAALTAVRATTPRLILLDIHLAGPMDGWDFLAAVKSDTRTAEIPVIITTITDRQAKGMALGASDYLIKPFGMGTLLKAVRRFLPEPEAAAVLVVEDDARFRSEMAEMLRFVLRSQVEEAGSGEEALVAIHRTAPQLVILDLLLPGIDGFTVLDTLRTRKATAQVPVLVVTGKTLTSAEKAQLTRGMVRVLTKEEYSRKRFLALIREAMGRGQKMVDGR